MCCMSDGHLDRLLPQMSADRGRSRYYMNGKICWDLLARGGGFLQIAMQFGAPTIALPRPCSDGPVEWLHLGVPGMIS